MFLQAYIYRGETLCAQNQLSCTFLAYIWHINHVPSNRKQFITIPHSERCTHLVGNFAMHIAEQLPGLGSPVRLL
jgi:hypothetical protein